MTSTRLTEVDRDGAELWIDAVNSNGDHHVHLANLTRLKDKWWRVQPVEPAFKAWLATEECRLGETITLERARQYGQNFLGYLQSLRLCMGYVEVQGACHE